jgi:uncharacterized repeat protein (TIGR03803 family)
VLYGTTAGGGRRGYGTVFASNLSGEKRVLYEFRGGADGQTPVGPLLLVDGKLYGATLGGGDPQTSGTIFEVTTSGVERALYRFKGGSDASCAYGGLISMNGALYGTSFLGGDRNCGTVFEVKMGGT